MGNRGSVKGLEGRGGGGEEARGKESLGQIVRQLVRQMNILLCILIQLNSKSGKDECSREHCTKERL